MIGPAYVLRPLYANRDGAPGHFERRAGDRHGRHAMLWLSPADLQASPIAEEAVDEKLDEWERESVRRRKEARRRVRADS